MRKQYFIYILVVYLIASCTSESPPSEPNTKPNVLFIAIDDLRPELNCYGASYMHTPNLDQLASQSRLFNHHYVQAPTCGASRYALLMGQYPTHVKYTSNQSFRDHLAEAKENGMHTLPQVFKANGYHTSCLGKISHYVDGKIYTYEGEGDGRLEMPDSWDTLWGPVGKWGTAWNSFFAYADGSNRNEKKKDGSGSPTEFVAEKDEDLPDGLIAAKAIEELKKQKDKSEPFFMAVGFFKPHLPFVAPKKYWDLYEGKELPLSPNPDMPNDVAPMAIPNSGEMFNNYQDQAERGGKGIRLKDENAMHLRRAYFAAVSYIDEQVGKLMQTLKETGLDKNTIVVVWGDHGWHLGDHTVWGKHTLFERSLRSAMMIKTPELKAKGTSSDAIVETVDLYPTLLDLAGLDALNPLSGKSLTPILNDPQSNWDKPALGFWRAGYSMRTKQHRLTKYKKGDEIFMELYDHETDPLEMKNLANLPPETGGAEKEIVLELEKELATQMPKGYWASLK